MFKKLVINFIWVFSFFCLFSFSAFASESPTLSIITPQNEEQLFGSKVQVSFITTHFIFSKRTNNYPGEGHLLAYLDDENATASSAQKITKAADFTLENVPPGSHVMTLELVNNDSSPLNPRITQTVNFKTTEKQIIPTQQDMSITPEDTTKPTLEINLTVVMLIIGVIVTLLTILVIFLISKKRH